MSNTAKLAQIERSLQLAEHLCRQRGERFTRRRRHVLALLLQHKGCVKAYDLLDELKKTWPRAAPPAIYRPLNFLMAQGLVHRIESLNAYIACTDPTHTHHGMLMVCGHCASVREVIHTTMDRMLLDTLRDSGFHAQGDIEINAVCQACIDAGYCRQADTESDDAAGDD